MVGRGCLVTVSPLAVVAAAVARLLLMPQKNCTPASGGFISFENCIMATNYIIIMHKITFQSCWPKKPVIFGIEQGHNILQNILTLQPPVLKLCLHKENLRTVMSAGGPFGICCLVVLPTRLGSGTSFFPYE
ncbi:hypothetical protein Y1Q_0015193 [Alligator mississippiensis]|uniref:Secreted protein n=1 Tax=Alligator mississippiensis TaxID=8496 RepID=A0A151P949_ALLMI|nr:hypothetical protein Y1Q_0015193 [Alligator mississippiensis]